MRSIEDAALADAGSLILWWWQQRQWPRRLQDGGHHAVRPVGVQHSTWRDPAGCPRFAKHLVVVGAELVDVDNDLVGGPVDENAHDRVVPLGRACAAPPSPPQNATTTTGGRRPSPPADPVVADSATAGSVTSGSVAIRRRLCGASNSMSAEIGMRRSDPRTVGRWSFGSWARCRSGTARNASPSAGRNPRRHSRRSCSPGAVSSRSTR
jgi:hypothetical protein